MSTFDGKYFTAWGSLLDGVPESEKITCPECGGGKYCAHCLGQGCPECQQSGMCPACEGHGLVAKE